MALSKIKIWLLAIRPKTLWAAIAPVMMGTAMAYRDGIYHFPTAWLALAGAVLIQIGTNLANDYFDFKKGTDASDRIGPVRVTQAGLLNPNVVKWSFILTFSAAALVAIKLIERGGTPIAVIGILSILSGIFYTAGPRPFGYLGLGELFVLIFFGPVAVGGTYYVQSFEINPAVLMAGLGPGFLSLAIIVVNNLRDIEGDARAGKKTLAVRFGRTFAKVEYLLAIFSAALIPVAVYFITQDYLRSLAATLILYPAIPAILTVLTKTDGPSLNYALAYTGALLFLYSVVFSVGWIL